MRLSKNFIIGTLLTQSFTLSGQINSEELSSLTPKSFVTQIEVIAGPGFSNLGRGKNAPTDQVFNFVFSFGLGISHSLSKRFDLNAKIIFEQKGNKMDYISTFYDVNGPTTSRFIQGNSISYVTGLMIPRCYLDTQRKLYMGLGGYLSFLLKSSTYTKEYSLQGDLISYYEAETNEFINYDLGLSFNLGYQVPIKNKMLLNLQLLHNSGLINIVNTNIQGHNDSSLKNNITSIVLGVTIKHNRYEKIH